MAVIAVGSVSVTVCLTAQETLSVTVQVYVPAVSPVAVAAVPPDGAQEYVFVPVPPDAKTVAAPVAAPLQVRFVCDDSDTADEFTVKLAAVLVALGFELPVAIHR